MIFYHLLLFTFSLFDIDSHFALLGTVSVLHLGCTVMGAIVQTVTTMSRMKLLGMRLLKLL